MLKSLEDFHEISSESRIGSPGMEYLIEEHQMANRRLKKNVKFNMAFEQSKVAAEYLSLYPTAQFEENLNSLLTWWGLAYQNKYR